MIPQAAEGEYKVRLLPPPVLEGGLPSRTSGVDPPAGEGERIQMNEPELAVPHDLGRQVLHARRHRTALTDLPKPQKVPLDTDPPIPLWNTWPVLALFLTVLVTGGCEKADADGIDKSGSRGTAPRRREGLDDPGGGSPMRGPSSLGSPHYGARPAACSRPTG